MKQIDNTIIELARECGLYVIATDRPRLERFAQLVLENAAPQPNTEPVAWAMKRPDGLILDVICPEEHESYEGEYTVPLYTNAPDDDGRDWSLLIATQESLREHMKIIHADTALLRQALEALEAMNPYPASKAEQRATAIAALRAALAEPVQEPVAFITPLMEQQMFDDWCPYKGNPDLRTVWAAAVESMNGLLLGASTPQRPAEPVQAPAQADDVADAAETVFSFACPMPKTCREHCCGGYCIPFLAGTVAARGNT